VAAFEAWLVFLILVVNVVGELQQKRTLAASRGFLAAARLSCNNINCSCSSSCYKQIVIVVLMHSRPTPRKNKNGATTDGNNVSDVIMAWRGRGTHRLYNVVVQPVVTTGCNNRLHSVNAA